MLFRIFATSGSMAWFMVCSCALAQKPTDNASTHDRERAVPGCTEEEPFGYESIRVRVSTQKADAFGLSLVPRVLCDEGGAVFLEYLIVNDSDTDLLISPGLTFSWEYSSGLPCDHLGFIPRSDATFGRRHYVLLRWRSEKDKREKVVVDNQFLAGRRIMDHGDEIKAWRGGAVSFRVSGHVLSWNPREKRYQKRDLSIVGTCKIGAEGIPMSKPAMSPPPTTTPADSRPSTSRR